MTLTLKMYPLTPKSIGFVSDLYSTIVLNTSPLGLTMPEKGGRQANTQINVEEQTDTHTDTER